MTRYQKAKYVCEMLAKEVTAHGLNMQVVLSELSEEELKTIEKVAYQCRTTREHIGEPQTVTFVLDCEQQFASFS